MPDERSVRLLRRWRRRGWWGRWFLFAIGRFLFAVVGWLLLAVTGRLLLAIVGRLTLPALPVVIGRLRIGVPFLDPRAIAIRLLARSAPPRALVFPAFPWCVLVRNAGCGVAIFGRIVRLHEQDKSEAAPHQAEHEKNGDQQRNQARPGTRILLKLRIARGHRGGGPVAGSRRGRLGHLEPRPGPDAPRDGQHLTAEATPDLLAGKFI